MSGMTAVKLFFNQTSPYARKARVAVHEKGLAGRVQFVETDPWANPPELLAVTPLSRVPALVLGDGSIVTESDAIIQVLDLLGETAPRLLPVEDGAARIEALARAGLCQGLIDASFIAVLENRRPAAGRWDDWVQRQRGAVERTLARIAQQFRPVSGRFDIGDIGLAVALGYLDFRHPDLIWRKNHPALADWSDRVAQRPSMQATKPA
jgi:glutathione S-transferase